MAFGSNIKKYIFLALALKLLAAPTQLHAGIWDRFTNWCKQKSTISNTCIVAIGSLLGATIGTLMWWRNNDATPKSTALSPEMQVIKKIEEELNPLTSAISFSVMRVPQKTKDGWVLELNKIESKLQDMQIRCQQNIFRALHDKYISLLADAGFKLRTKYINVYLQMTFKDALEGIEALKEEAKKEKKDNTQETANVQHAHYS